MIDAMAKSIEEKARVAQETADISKQSAQTVADGNAKMQELKVAIGEISKCSEDIAEETEASMDQVMEEAEASTKRMVDMAQALQAEVSSVQQIDENIAHVAGIVDNNSASSQETAAVSEEQSAQVHTMLQLMHQFQI